MEKDLCPIRGEAPPLADYAPRMERVPDGECGCGGDGQEGGHHHGHHDHGGHGHPHGEGCGCQSPVGTPCGGCVGHEGCGTDSWGLCEYPLAMVYAPCQSFRGLYDPATALSRGTLFSELDLPFGKDSGGLTSLACSCRRERSQS
jgi:hypothetical protein